jgi:hypothetical protein
MIQISITKKIGRPDTYVNQGIKGVRKLNRFFFDLKVIKREEGLSSPGGRRSESFWKSGGFTASFLLSTL